MRKLALALAAIAGLGFTAPAFAASEPDSRAAGMQMAQVDVRIGGPSRFDRRDRDRGYRRDYRRGREFGRGDRGGRTTIIKRRGNGTVVKKVITR